MKGQERIILAAPNKKSSLILLFIVDGISTENSPINNTRKEKRTKVFSCWTKTVRPALLHFWWCRGRCNAPGRCYISLLFFFLPGSPTWNNGAPSGSCCFMCHVRPSSIVLEHIHWCGMMGYPCIYT